MKGGGGGGGEVRPGDRPPCPGGGQALCGLLAPGPNVLLGVKGGGIGGRSATGGGRWSKCQSGP